MLPIAAFHKLFYQCLLCLQLDDFKLFPVEDIVNCCTAIILKNCANLWNGKAKPAQNCNSLELQSICLGELPIPVFCYPWLD